MAVHAGQKLTRRRGLLCAECNMALGLLGDDPDRLERLAAYVRRWKGVVGNGWQE